MHVHCKQHHTHTSSTCDSIQENTEHLVTFTSLHWLPVQLRTVFNTIILVWKCIHYIAPVCRLQLCMPLEHVRSSSSVVVHINSMRPLAKSTDINWKAETHNPAFTDQPMNSWLQTKTSQVWLILLGLQITLIKNAYIAVMPAELHTHLIMARNTPRHTHIWQRSQLTHCSGNIHTAKE